MPPKKTPVSGEAAAVNGGEGGSTSAQPMVNGKPASLSDTKFFFTVLENLTSKPDANWQAVADAMGYKDIKCTKERWRQIMNKYELVYPDSPAPAAKGRGKKVTAATTDDPDPEPAAPKPKTPRSKKAAASAVPKSAATAISDDEPGSAEVGTPAEETAGPITPAEENVGPETPAEENAGQNTPATPTPSTKATRGRKPGSSAKKRAAPPADDDGAEGADGTPPKKKPTPRKPRGPNKKTLAAQEAAAATLANATTETPAADVPANDGPETPASVDTEMNETVVVTNVQATEASESSLSSVHSSVFGDDAPVPGDARASSIFGGDDRFIN